MPVSKQSIHGDKNGASGKIAVCVFKLYTLLLEVSIPTTCQRELRIAMNIHFMVLCIE